MTSDSSPARKESLIAALISLVVYLATLTGNYYWDGLTFSLQIERVSQGAARPSLFFHQNHLVYSAAGYVLYSVFSKLGVAIRALYILQATNCLAAALAVGVLYNLVRKRTNSVTAAIATSAAFAMSAGWWKMATDADAYVFSVLFMLVSFRLLLSEKDLSIAAGIALAAAMLMHELAALFYPAAFVYLLLTQPIKRRLYNLFAFTLAAWIPTLAAYTIVARWIGIQSAIGVLQWAISNQSGVSASINPKRGILLLPRSNLDLIVGHSFSRFWHYRQPIETAAAIVAVALLLVCLALIIVSFKRESMQLWFRVLNLRMKSAMAATDSRRLIVTLSIWLAAYLVFLVFWEPWQVYYRVFYVPALAMLVAVLLTRREEDSTRRTTDFNSSRSDASMIANSARIGLPGSSPHLVLISIAALGAFNLAFYILPNMRTISNPIVNEAKSTAAVWGQNTTVYFLRRNEADTAFEYFNPSTQWHRLASRNSDAIERELVSALDAGQNVWINLSVVEALDSGFLEIHSAREIRATAPNEPARYVELSN